MIEIPFPRKMSLCGMLLACMLAACGCGNEEPQQDQPVSKWSQYAGEVIVAARARDYETLVEHLSIYKAAGRREFMGADAQERPPARSEDDYLALSDGQARRLAMADARRFVRAYEDLFEGKPVRVCPSLISRTDAGDVYSVIIWVKVDEKYRGIKIDAVWERPETVKTVRWMLLTSQLEDIWRNRPIIKRAVLVSDTLENCIYPDEIQYEYIRE